MKQRKLGSLSLLPSIKAPCLFASRCFCMRAHCTQKLLNTFSDPMVISARRGKRILEAASYRPRYNMLCIQVQICVHICMHNGLPMYRDGRRSRCGRQGIIARTHEHVGSLYTSQVQPDSQEAAHLLVALFERRGLYVVVFAEGLNDIAWCKRKGAFLLHKAPMSRLLAPTMKINYIVVQIGF